jgi:hypothetical protein
MTRYLLLFDSYGIVLWGALSDERTGLSFVYAAGPRQRSLSRVRVHWNSWPNFTVSNLRFPFSSPPTTRRVTVEVFDPASTQVNDRGCACTQQYKDCWKLFSVRYVPILMTESSHNFVLGPRQGLTPRKTGWLTVGRNITSTLTEWSLESAVSSRETDQSEVVGDSRPLAEALEAGEPHCWKPLCSNAQLAVRQTLASEDSSRWRRKLRNLQGWEPSASKDRSRWSRKMRSRCQAAPSEDWEDMVSATVNSKARELVKLLSLLVIPSWKRAINPITKPNPVYSHSVK